MREFNDRDRFPRNGSPPRQRRVDELLEALEKPGLCPEDEFGLEFTRALIESGEWAHAAHSALRSVTRSRWLSVFERDDLMLELVGELENAFGTLPEDSYWVDLAQDKWLRLAVIMMAKSWGFQAVRKVQQKAPAHW